MQYIKLFRRETRLQIWCHYTFSWQLKCCHLQIFWWADKHYHATTTESKAVVFLSWTTNGLWSVDHRSHAWRMHICMIQNSKAVRHARTCPHLVYPAVPACLFKSIYLMNEWYLSLLHCMQYENYEAIYKSESKEEILLYKPQIKTDVDLIMAQIDAVSKTVSRFLYNIYIA